jgi:hypothetical protein
MQTTLAEVWGLLKGERVGDGGAARLDVGCVIGEDAPPPGLLLKDASMPVVMVDIAPECHGHINSN